MSKEERQTITDLSLFILMTVMILMVCSSIVDSWLSEGFSIVTQTLLFNLSNIGLFFLLNWWFKWKCNRWLQFLVVSLVFTHYIGWYGKLYEYWLGYDKFLHAVTPFFIALAFCYLCRKNLNFYQLMLIWLAVIGCCTGFEIFEYAVDNLLGLEMQGVFDSSRNMLMSKIDDTMIDLILGVIGSGWGIIIGRFAFRQVH